MFGLLPCYGSFLGIDGELDYHLRRFVSDAAQANLCYFTSCRVMGIMATLDQSNASHPYLLKVV